LSARRRTNARSPAIGSDLRGCTTGMQKGHNVSPIRINDIDAPPRVQIEVSPPRVINGATPGRVFQPTVITSTTPNSHWRLSPTPARSGTPNTPHAMIRRSAHQQNLTNGMLAETIQQANHVFSLPTGPTIRSPTQNTKDTPIIIMPEMANAVICPDTGKSLEHQELITMLRYKIKWMRSTANEIRRLYKTNTIKFIRKSDIPPGRKDTYGSFVVDIKEHKEETGRTRLTVGCDQVTYPGDKSTCTAGITTAKILINSVISTKGARFLVVAIKNIYLNTPLGRFEYMVINLSYLPQEIINEFGLLELAHDGRVYIEIQKGMYGLL
jgi:hypothetical protein